LQSDYYQYGNVARRGRGGGLENKDCGGTANTVDTVGAYFSLRKGRARRGEARKGTKGRRSPRMNANSIQSVCRTLKSERNSRSFVYLRTQLRRTPFYFHTDVASLAGTWKQQHNIKLRNGQQSNRRCFCDAHTSCPACSGSVRAAGEGDNMIREIAILFSMLRRLRCRRAARKCIGFTALDNKILHSHFLKLSNTNNIKFTPLQNIQLILSNKNLNLESFKVGFEIP